jgi:hypothetical protein
MNTDNESALPTGFFRFPGAIFSNFPLKEQLVCICIPQWTAQDSEPWRLFFFVVHHRRKGIRNDGTGTFITNGRSHGTA